MTRAIAVALLIFGAADAAIPYSSRMRTFSITHKPGQGINPGQELELCDFVPATGVGQHAVLISWWTGSIPWLSFADTVIKYYVDGEASPSIARHDSAEDFCRKHGAAKPWPGFSFRIVLRFHDRPRPSGC